MLQTSDALGACDRSGRVFVCTRETASMPAELVTVALDGGAIEPLFQPNHALAAQMPQAERIEWRTARGEEASGLFFAAKSQRADVPAPAVVLQYETRGFMKGGTGDEWPVALLVRNGISVFVVQRLEDRAAYERYNFPEINTRVFGALEYRWMPLRAIESGLDLLAQQRRIDRRSVGVTGMSDGCATMLFLLLHDDRFAAASGSCMGEDLLTYYLGSQFGQQMTRRDLRADPADPLRNFYYQQTLLALNARRIVTPILAHHADREFMSGMQNYAALKEAGRPLELHLFADEYHWKWQPRHREVIYARNVDWLRYWLQDWQDPDPAKAAQYARWDALRVQRDAARADALPPLPVPDWAKGEVGDEAWFAQHGGGAR